MKLKFMQLGKNLETNEDNEKDTWDKVKSKLEEEYKELIEAIEERNLLHVAEETFDVIQVAIRSLVLLKKENLNLEQLNMRHNRKLVNRGWQHVNIIRILWDK
ncbi:hypothetical protein [Clostridium sp.]|uniref:hypothetical protein n=1 Tax=Clostridium sp. TaxID=1506 RepID=UPI00284C96FE|nr:hypothetical protein [Clostridium sp.]MDR3593802.1 hypothetical protein [Clostridium sp.]